MLRVGHFVDQYPVKAHGFIYDQVVRSGTREDRLLAAVGASAWQGGAWCLVLGAWLGQRQVRLYPAKRQAPSTKHQPSEHDVAALHTIPHPAIAQFTLFERLYRHVWERHLARRYRAKLARFLLAQDRSKRLDVLHAHFGMAAVKLVDAREKLGIPLVTTFYGVDASACLRDGYWLQQYERLFACGDLFIVLSEAVVERLVAAGCPREKIVVWNIGIDFDAFPYRERRGECAGAPPACRGQERDDARERPGDDRRPLAPTPVRVLCAARFVEKKGHAILLDAFRQLAQRRPATLTLIGYGPLLPQVRTAIERHGLRDRVRIIDTARPGDFDGLFRSALEEHDLFALPSIVARNGDDEGGPALTLVCAQASGVPVVSTPFVGAERSVLDGETGLLCRSGCPDDLAEKMLLLCESPALARRIGQAGSERVRREFSLDGQRAAMQQQYERVLRGGGSRCSALGARLGQRQVRPYPAEHRAPSTEHRSEAT